MNISETKSYFLTKPEAVLDFPFGPDIMVFKVKGKMFATLGERQQQPQMNLKCDPNEALILRDIFDAVVPGYHMNKQHWNTVYLDQSVPANELKRMIDNSYALVAKSLSKRERDALLARFGEAPFTLS